MLREMSDREKQILHDITYMQNLNKKKGGGGAKLVKGEQKKNKNFQL